MVRVCIANSQKSSLGSSISYLIAEAVVGVTSAEPERAELSSLFPSSSPPTVEAQVKTEEGEVVDVAARVGEISTKITTLEKNELVLDDVLASIDSKAKTISADLELETFSKKMTKTRAERESYNTPKLQAALEAIPAVTEEATTLPQEFITAIETGIAEAKEQDQQLRDTLTVQEPSAELARDFLHMQTRGDELDFVSKIGQKVGEVAQSIAMEKMDLEEEKLRLEAPSKADASQEPLSLSEPSFSAEPVEA